MKRDKAYICKILEDINDIEIFLNNVSYDEFLLDSMLKKAVCMSLINIGESVKSISSEIKAEKSDIPWKKAIALRDVVAHKYGTIDFDIVWQTVNEDIPIFKDQIKKLLSLF